MSALQRAAKSSGSPQIALLAASAQLDAFTKVKALIDKMVAADQQIMFFLFPACYRVDFRISMILI